MKPELLQLAHARVADGSLPHMERFRTYGGPGTGQPCALCRGTISRESLEILVESETDSSTLIFHVKCQAAWLVAIANQLVPS